MLLSLQQITNWLIVYKYIIYFPLTVFEGPIVTVIAAFLASAGVFSLAGVYAVSVAGDFVGDSLYYLIGKYGRAGFIDRWGKYIGLTSERVEQLHNRFKKHGWRILLFGKWSQVFGAPILTAAGVAGMPYWKFIGYNMLGTLLKSAIWIIIGFYFGEAYASINRYFNYATVIALSIAVLIGVVYYFYYRRRKNRPPTL